MTTLNQALICNNFTGIKKVQTSFSSSLISASDMQNVELFDTGINSGVGIRTMFGNESVFEFEDENIINTFRSVQQSEEYFFIHTEDDSEGKIYLYDALSNTVTLKVDGLDVTGVSCGTDFAQGWDDLFIFSNGVNILSIQIGHYDENSNLDEVTNMDLVGTEDETVAGLGLIVFDGRLWIFNQNRLFYSVKENCYDFSTSTPGITTSAGYIEFVKNITAITPYLGALAIFHSDSSEMLSVDSDYSYSVSKESPGGCFGPNSLTFYGAQLYFYDDTKKSVFAFSQIVNGETTLIDNIAKDIQDEFFDISSLDKYNLKMFSVIQSDRNEIWLILPPKDGYSEIFIFDCLYSCWVKRKSQGISSLLSFKDEFYSSSDNKLLLEYTGDSFDGEFIEAFYSCAPFNLGVDNSLKVLYIPPRVTLDMEYTNEFFVEYIRDYNALNKIKRKFIKADSLKNLFVWDVSYWDDIFRFKPKNSNSIKRLPTEHFKTLQITFKTNDLNQGFAIKNIELSNIKVKQV